MSFEDAVKLLMVSFDSTLESQSLGRPAARPAGDRERRFCPAHERRIEPGDPYFEAISNSWSNALRNAFHSLPDYSFFQPGPVK